MAKFLKIGGDPGGERWTLPEDADVDKLREQLAAAMEDEKPVVVKVVVGKGQVADLIVNTGEVAAVLVWEDAPAGGGMTIID